MSDGNERSATIKFYREYTAADLVIEFNARTSLRVNGTHACSATAVMELQVENDGHAGLDFKLRPHFFERKSEVGVRVPVAYACSWTLRCTLSATHATLDVPGTIAIGTWPRAT